MCLRGVSERPVTQVAIFVSEARQVRCIALSAKTNALEAKRKKPGKSRVFVETKASFIT